MPNWKKVIVSGSNAVLNQITASGAIISTNANSNLSGSFSGSFQGDGTNLNLASNTTIPTQNPFPLTASSAAIISRSIAAADTDSTALRLFSSGSVSQSGIFEVEGSAGPLFSVADGLDGILMEVNNISGLPLFQVSSSNEVFINRGNLTSGITTATASFASFSGSFQGDGSGLTNLNTTTPTLQQVVDQGSSTTTAITASAISSSTLTSAGDLTLDADGADILLKDGGTEFGRFKRDSSNFVIKSATSNKDIIFRGDSGGGTVNALTLDMSDGGKALFNGGAQITGSLSVSGSGISFIASGGTVFSINNTGSFTIGEGATAANDTAVAIGKSANATSNGVSIGGNSNASLVNTVSIGGYSSVTGQTGIAIGYDADVSGYSAIGIGAYINNSAGRSVVFNATGDNAVNHSKASASAFYMTSKTIPDFEFVAGGTSTFTDSNLSGSATSTASFGTYIGDGSNLTGVSAFPFTGDAQITGSLTISGSFEAFKLDADDIVLGSGAGEGMTESDQNNIIIGTKAVGSGEIDGIIDTIAIGHAAGYNLTTGDNNILIGSGSGDTLTTGYSNIMIGDQADGSTSNTYQSIVIGQAASITGGASGIAIGNSVVGMNNSVTIGSSANTNNVETVTIGGAADSNNARRVDIGKGASGNGYGGIAIGYTVTSNAGSGVAIGYNFTNALASSFQWGSSAGQKLTITTNSNLLLNNLVTPTAATHFDDSATNVITIGTGSAPDANVAHSVQLYAQTGSSEAGLQLRTSGGKIHTLADKIDFTTATAISGSTFSGSFVGDGTNLTGITAKAGSTTNRVVFTTTGGVLTTESGFEYDTEVSQLTVESLNVTHLTSSFITSSRIHTSGSNIFGDEAGVDVQTLIGTTKMTGSAQVTGSTSMLGALDVIGDAQITGSLTVSGSFLPHGNSATSNVVIGTTTGPSGGSNVIIGTSAGHATTNGGNVAIGANSTNGANTNFAVAIGQYATNSGTNAIAIGYSTAAGGNGIAIGRDAEASSNGIAIGKDITANASQLEIGFETPIISASLSTGHVILSGSTGGLELIGSGSTVFEVIGSEGTLFSVDDDLDGTIFTANDRSGLPVLEASASGEVYIGKAPQSLYTTAVISSTTAETTQSIFGLSTSSYGGAFFDYTVHSGSNARAGSIMSVWNGGNISFTETTTTDIGDTTDFNVIVHISQSQAQIASHATRAGYNIKTIIRSI